MRGAINALTKKLEEFSDSKGLGGVSELTRFGILGAHWARVERIQKKIVKWSLGLGIWAGVSGFAPIPSVCVNCQLPQISAATVLGMEAQLAPVEQLASFPPAPAMPQPFGQMSGAFGMVPSQAPVTFPNLLQLTSMPAIGSVSASGTANAAPSWVDRVQPGFLPADFGRVTPILPPDPISQDSYRWVWSQGISQNGVTQADGYSQFMTEFLWSTGRAPWADAARFWQGSAAPQVPRVI